jgi:hypothetical protein
MGQQSEKRDCAICGKPMVKALSANDKGPPILKCIECDPLQDEKVRAWIEGGLRPSDR